MKWDDFTDIRSALIESNANGRKPFDAKTSSCNLNVAIASDISIPPENEEMKPILESQGVVLTSAIKEGESLIIQSDENGIDEKDWEHFADTTPQDDRAWINTIICGKHDNNCPYCVKALGQNRSHKKGSLGDAECSMSADLSGPHPISVATPYKYMMIIAIRLEKGKNLPFVRGLVGKEARGIVDALKSVMAELKSMFGVMPPIVRFHSDGGGEFMNRELTAFLLEKSIHKTSTDGHDPQGNGLAERFVGIIKQRTCGYLSHAGFGLRYWFWAAMQAAFVYRSAILGTNLTADGIPTFGHRVLVRKPGVRAKSKTSFEDKSDEAIFLCWDSSTVNGAYVGIVGPTGALGTRKVSAPTPWPRDSIPT
jgi:hypothetical protein